MTKKDFISLALCLANLKPGPNKPEAALMWYTIVREVAHTCEKANSRFNWTLFVRACGLD